MTEPLNFDFHNSKACLAFLLSYKHLEHISFLDQVISLFSFIITRMEVCANKCVHKAKIYIIKESEVTLLICGVVIV